MNIKDVFSTLAITAAVAATLAGAEPPDTPPTAEERLRAVKLDDGGEITLVERRGNGLRVAFTLAPTPKSFIRCELGLAPSDKWDGRLWGFGNGGWAGAVSFHYNGTSACVHSDLGTSKSPYEETPTDREILRDYAWRATHLMTVAAKRLVEAYYGRQPDKCYFSGASCGGLQGVQEAARFPEDYDGIISEVPGITERSRSSNAWRHKRLKEKYGKSPTSPRPTPTSPADASSSIRIPRRKSWTAAGAKLSPAIPPLRTASSSGATSSIRF